MLFRKHNFTRESFDPSRKNILILDNGNLDEYSNTRGVGRSIGGYFQTQRTDFNVIYISTTKCSVNNLLTLNLDYLSSNVKKRSKDANATGHNTQFFKEQIKTLFKELCIFEIEYFIGSNDTFFHLLMDTFVSKTKNELLNQRKNTFFDYLGDDPEIYQMIDETNTKIVNNFDYYISPSAFMSRHKWISFNLVSFLKESGILKHKCVFFLIDPTLYTPFFIKNKIPHTFCYFANDNRGTRNFTGVDISQIQHIIYDQKHLGSSLSDFTEKDENPKNLIFYGTIFQEKGPRADMYYQFLHDFVDPDGDDLSDFFIPYIKNRAILFESSNKRGFNKNLKETFGQLYDDISNNKNVADNDKILYANEIPSYLIQYKYTLILRCVSPEDSLNFRPVLSVLYDTLPFFDSLYDPDNLQIPPEFNEHLVVRNADDLMKKIAYYNEHEKERRSLVQRLRDHFRVDYYLEHPKEALQMQIQNIMPELFR